MGDWLCQRYGRKITIYIGSVLIIIGGLWNAFAQDLGQYAGGEQSYTNSCAILTPARVIVGTGGAITKVAAPALLHEIAHPRLRATFGTLYYGWYHLGGLVSGIVVSE